MVVPRAVIFMYSVLVRARYWLYEMPSRVPVRERKAASAMP